MQIRDLTKTAAVLLMPMHASAQTSADPGALLESPLDPSRLLGLTGSLVLVIVAIIVVGWIFSRLRGMSFGSNQAISVLATQPLGPKERIVVVQIGDTQLAVGMTPTQLQTLHVFENHAIKTGAIDTPPSFAEKIRSAMGNVRRK